jgi:hypothetical protein
MASSSLLMVRAQSLPPVDIIVIGAQKSGTTSIWAALARQPWFIRAHSKELHHFGAPRPVPDHVYRSWFPESHRPDARRGEATPDYLASMRAPARIREHNADVRLIALLRDPVDRAVSAFLHARQLGHVGAHESFEQVFLEEAHRRTTRRAWTRIRWDGMYARHLQRYLDEFPAEQLHIEYFEDLTAHPVEALSRLWSFLGVDGATTAQFPHRNPSRTSRFPRLNGRMAVLERRFRRRGHVGAAAAIQRGRAAMYRPAEPVPLTDALSRRITAHYAEEVALLPKIVGRTPPWPRFTDVLGVDTARDSSPEAAGMTKVDIK